MGLVVAVAAGEVEHGGEASSEQDVLANVSGDAFVAVGDGRDVGVGLVGSRAEVGQGDVDSAWGVALRVVLGRADIDDLERFVAVATGVQIAGGDEWAVPSMAFASAIPVYWTGSVVVAKGGE